MVNVPVPKATRQTKEVLAQKKRKLLATAKELYKLAPERVRVLPLAQAFGVSALTARKWLAGAGLDLTAKRGRPVKGETAGFHDVMTLIGGAAEVGAKILQHGEQAAAENPETDD